jgi:hypothetical protein
MLCRRARSTCMAPSCGAPRRPTSGPSTEQRTERLGVPQPRPHDYGVATEVPCHPMKEPN